jgi:serine protease Do
MDLTKRQGRSAHISKRSNAFKRAAQLVLPILVLCFLANDARVDGQQLRDVFRSVQAAAVIVRTEQIGLAPFPQQGLVSSDGLGSGVLISNDRVLTAAHLVESADKTIVEFSQGEIIRANVIGCSLSADVALLKLERSPVNSVAAKLGDSDQVAVGDEIFVIGAPYGISNTLTAGHVSARRPLKDRSQVASGIEFLQTDAAVNNGNSGSPVFNMKGEIVGIVSNIMSKSGGSEGLAFAATSNTARRFLLEQKPFWTGIEGLLVNGSLARALNLPQPAGVLVQRVAEGSIAARCGLHPGTLRATVEGEGIILGGDVILAVNGFDVNPEASCDEIYEQMARTKLGENLVITVFRQGRTIMLAIPIPNSTQ